MEHSPSSSDSSEDYGLLKQIPTLLHKSRLKTPLPPSQPREDRATTEVPMTPKRFALPFLPPSTPSHRKTSLHPSPVAYQPLLNPRAPPQEFSRLQQALYKTRAEILQLEINKTHTTENKNKRKRQQKKNRKKRFKLKAIVELAQIRIQKHGLQLCSEDQRTLDSLKQLLEQSETTHKPMSE
ncbi:unnamed protein product [Moneuplotes crassus]|uniref:Uncharacterized protein n=1 Tax=Euplotes crassus TaxID=5936 RepID=A0AAD1XSA5_EUPCR|nr:unnamed protein product [Moneuplotes crassus]